jgi:hypothetical protein
MYSLNGQVLTEIQLSCKKCKREVQVLTAYHHLWETGPDGWRFIKGVGWVCGFCLGVVKASK